MMFASHQGLKAPETEDPVLNLRLRTVATLALWGALAGLMACPAPLQERPADQNTAAICEAGALDPGPGYARRLTHQEYIWSIHDILGVDLSAWRESLPRESYVDGFKNTAWGLTVSSRHVEVYAHLAREATAALSNDHRWLRNLSLCEETAERCARMLVEEAGMELFRRPLSSDETRRFAALLAQESSPEAGARLVIEAMLQAPQFLYRLESDRAPDTLNAAALKEPDAFVGTLAEEGIAAPLSVRPGTYRVSVQLANDAPHPIVATLSVGEVRSIERVAPFRTTRLSLQFAPTTAGMTSMQLAASPLHRPPGAPVAPRVIHVEVLGPLASQLNAEAESSYETRALSGFEMASRLSYFIWHSAPDRELLNAAAGGELDDAEGVARWARTMLEDARARRAFKSYLAEWLHLDTLATVERSPERFPDFSEHLIEDMRLEIENFSQAIAFDDQADWLSIFDARFSYLTPRLARYYGMETEAAPDEPTAFDENSPRGGLLTQGALLTASTSNDTTSPVKRGIFVRERFLCQSVPSPASNAVMQAAPDTEGLSTRERLQRHSDDPSCNFCHRAADPIGFGLEAFDATGRHRSVDDTGHPLDVRGAITQSPYERDTLHFEGARQLGELLSESENAERCMVEQMYQYAVGRPTVDVDRCTLNAIIDEARSQGRSYTDITVAIVSSEAFRHVRQHRYPGGTP
ncbi:DUF1592 domain-containing protein [Bradymonadaceae bacterium TMQ3]|nr:DUF1592 domain-containing protein [Bradymonadaceae bacterium TMQ3]TXC77199.1 DUF1592 domain-containing protein [Bradymonadales bacterium TMQ1]